MFVITDTINNRLKDLCPMLLEGATSSGKTSLVEYIAPLTKHKCVRIYWEITI